MLVDSCQLSYANNCELFGVCMARTASIGIRVEPEVKEALESAAKADHRTVASYIEKLLIEDLKAKGLLWKNP